MANQGPEGFDKRLALPAAAVAVVAIAVRCAALWAAGQAGADELFAADPDGYLALAENVWRHGVFGSGEVPTAYRPPAYPLALAPGLLFGEQAGRYFASLHVLLGAATAVLVWQMALRQGPRGWAFAAAMFVAGDPILLRQSALPMTETLAALLATVVWLLLVRCDERPTLWRASLAGGVLGMAALARPAFLAVGVLALLALAWQARRATRGGMRLAVFAVALVLPLGVWAARNQVALGHPVVTTTHGGYTLLLGNNDLYYRHLRTHSWRTPWSAAELDARVHRDRLATGSVDETVLDQRDYQEARAHIAREPAMFARACLVRLATFWDVAPRGSGDGATGRWKSAARWAVAAWYVLEWLLVVAGLWSLGRHSLRGHCGWGLLLTLACLLPHVVYWSDMRMRAPAMPVAAVLAATGGRWLFGRNANRK